jgi:protein-tyrosine phosphatase
MASILVVCSGNICRSPVAEGLLRRALEGRLGDAAPLIASAGTIAMDGAPASEGSVIAARELDVDISNHRARALTDRLIEDADLCLSMAGEHRDEIAARVPEATDRAFTLKELVRLLERLPPAAVDPVPAIRSRVAEAADLRSGNGRRDAVDDDVVDPLGMPLETYRAVAWELDGWIERLVAGLFGPVPVTAGGR